MSTETQTPVLMQPSEASLLAATHRYRTDPDCVDIFYYRKTIRLIPSSVCPKMGCSSKRAKLACRERTRHRRAYNRRSFASSPHDGVVHRRKGGSVSVSVGTANDGGFDANAGLRLPCVPRQLHQIVTILAAASQHTHISLSLLSLSQILILHSHHLYSPSIT